MRNRFLIAVIALTVGAVIMLVYSLTVIRRERQFLEDNSSNGSE